MKLRKGDNVVEVPDMGLLIDVIYKPKSWHGSGYMLMAIARDRFEGLDRKMEGPPAYCCAFPHCVTVWPPLDDDGEIIVRYHPTAKQK